MLSRRLEYGTEKQIVEAIHLSQKVGRMLHGLSIFLKAKPIAPAPTTENL
jgi:hypothetical protein